MEKAEQRLHALRSLWDGKRGARPMPSRADLHVTMLRPWIGNLALIDVSESGDGAFRLCGTNLHARFGGEVTKRRLATLDRQIIGSLQRCIPVVRQSRSPQELDHHRVIEGTALSFRELCLPLSDDGKNVCTLLFVSYPIEQKMPLSRP